MDAIAVRDESVPVLAERLRATEVKRRELTEQLDRAHEACAPAWATIERQIRQSLTDWRTLFAGDVARVREAFRGLLTSPIIFTPFVERGYRAIRFEGRFGKEAVFGAELVTKMASPTGFEPVF